MYHAIVRRRVVALFAVVSKGDARPVLDGLAPTLTNLASLIPRLRWRSGFGNVGRGLVVLALAAASRYRLTFPPTLEVMLGGRGCREVSQ